MKHEINFQHAAYWTQHNCNRSVTELLIRKKKLVEEGGGMFY